MISSLNLKVNSYQSSCLCFYVIESKISQLYAVRVITLRVDVCNAQAAVPALYMLGDSLVDVGNNNYLPRSTAKANHPHNGIDYPNKKSTGRFSNGENAADFIAKKIGLQTSPPYLSLKQGETPPITGVSFASGGSGILNETGQNHVEYISLARQVDYFSMIHDKLVQQLGASASKTHLSKSIFTIVSGNNDLFAYFSVGSSINKASTPQQYIERMLSSYKGLLKKLYGLGARKIVVAGVAALGCCPSERKTDKTGECNVTINNWTTKYNDGLKIMLQKLKSESAGLNFAYFDIYRAMSNLFRGDKSYGFMNIKEACCGIGNLNADAPCMPTSSCCPVRKTHIFWDLVHPTEAVVRIFSDIIFNGTQEYMVPINLKQLIVI
ncbi:GDSL esterase/lipase At5g55050-like [Rutidosis leptorrhynchoides]|uniref:GDSL esterase/lipase At5g55050-like n=1 Tax=Rutidosis leptorrhynchoides TaxID=125765 RepID=UPI003A9929B0